MAKTRTRTKIAVAVAGLVVVAAFLWSVASLNVGPGFAVDGERNPDAVALASVGKQALERARDVAADAVLRQVHVDPRSERRSFHFVDGAATREIAVYAPSPTTPADRWRVVLPEISKLTGHSLPGLDLDALRVGPDAAGRAATAHWGACTLRGLTLAGQRDELTWVVFCDLPDGGVVSGTVDGRAGAFRPSTAPPAYPPPTATPSQ